MKRLPGVGLAVGVLMMALGLSGYAAVDIASGGTPEPPLGLGAVQPATPMPGFKLPLVNGDLFDSSTLQGKVVVVRFWATW